MTITRYLTHIDQPTYQITRQMEKKIGTKTEMYISEFKNKIKDKMLNMELLGTDAGKELLQFIYDYNALVFEKEDFVKRVRVKNIVPIFDRCCAKRASGEQCTRRKKSNCEYCGTHLKGVPHGVILLEVESNPVQNIEVTAVDIRGIIYYIDGTCNVYQTEDILLNKINPKIVANYVKNVSSNGVETFSIPEFNV